MQANNIPKEVFTSGLLDEEHHKRLILDIEQIAQTAGVPVPMIWSKLSDYCSPEEFEYIRHIKSTKHYGLLYTGEQKPSVQDKMMAITGALLRNHMDCRLMVLQNVLHLLKNDAMPEPRCLCIPNFCLGSKEGGDIPSWEVSALVGLIYNRGALGLQTVLYAQSLAVVGVQYGTTLSQYLETHYKVL